MTEPVAASSAPGRSAAPSGPAPPPATARSAPAPRRRSPLRGRRVPARWRIAAWIVLTTGLTLFAIVLTMRSLLTHDVENAANQTIRQELDEFTSFAEEGVDPRTGAPFDNVSDLLEVYLQRQHPASGEVLVGVAPDRLLHSDNTNLTTETGEPYQLAADDALLERILSSDDASGTFDTDHGQLRWARLTLTGDGEPGHFVAAIFVADNMAQADRILDMVALVALGGLILTAGISYVVAGQILAPVRAIGRAASRISESDLSVRVPVHTRDDLGELAESFNGMLDRIEEAYTTQRRFVDDASHELRTPITVIRGHLELLEADEDPAERARTLAVVDGELGRMSRIVTDLLLLAKAERPDFVAPAPTDLADLVLGMESSLQALDERPWLLMEVAEGRAEVDAQRLTQVMLQYGANAVQYSPPGTPVRFGSTLVNPEAEGAPALLRLWLADEGPGIAEEDVPYVFERFHRGAHSTGAHSTGGQAAGPGGHTGFGLGLSIVRAIADAHGGRSWVESALGQGATFGIDVPVRLLPADAAPPQRDNAGDAPSRHRAALRTLREQGDQREPREPEGTGGHT